MVDELIENIEAYLRLNTIGDLSDRLTIDHIHLSLRKHKEAKKFNVQNQLKARNAMTTYYGGTNPLD